MGRKEITAGLSALLEKRLGRTGHLWAREVSIEALGRCRPDYLEIEAPWGKLATVSSVERATVTAYEVKSCLADYKSGNGLNAVGDFNYVVMPYELMRKVAHLTVEDGMDDPFGGSQWGVLYPIPEDFRMGRDDPEGIPRYTGQVDGWKLHKIESMPYRQEDGRQIPVSVVLWCMAYAGIKRGLPC